MDGQKNIIRIIESAKVSRMKKNCALPSLGRSSKCNKIKRLKTEYFRSDMVITNHSRITLQVVQDTQLCDIHYVSISLTNLLCIWIFTLLLSVQFFVSYNLLDIFLFMRFPTLLNILMRHYHTTFFCHSFLFQTSKSTFLFSILQTNTKMDIVPCQLSNIYP